MGLIQSPRRWRPSYKAGYARYGRETRHPHLWDGLHTYFNFALGETGARGKSLIRGKEDCDFVNMDVSDWVRTEHGAGLNFTRATDDYLRIENYSCPTLPLTLMWWVSIDSGFGAGNNLCGPGFGDSGTGLWDGWLLLRRTENVFGATSVTNNSFAPVVGTTTVVADRWYCVVGRFASNTLRELWLDGKYEANNTSSNNPAGQDYFRCGMEIGTPSIHGLDGKTIETAAWDRALTDSEIQLLAQRPGLMCELKPRRFYYAASAPATGGAVIGGPASGAIPHIIGS